MYNILQISRLFVALVPLIYLEPRLGYANAVLASAGLFLLFFKNYEMTAIAFAGLFLLFTILVELLDNLAVADIIAAIFFYFLVLIFIIVTIKNNNAWLSPLLKKIKYAITSKLYKRIKKVTS